MLKKFIAFISKTFKREKKNPKLNQPILISRSCDI